MFDYQNALIPAPQVIQDGGAVIRLSNGFRLQAEDRTDPVFVSAVALLTKSASQEGGYPVCLKVDPTAGPAEGYRLQITQDGATIAGADSAGAFYGAVTFGKLLQTEDGTLCLPATTIEDYPDFRERGIFLEDRYGSEFMTLDDYKDAIDRFAAMKLNSLAVGIYGCWSVQYDNQISEYFYLPSEKYPHLKSPKTIKYYDPKSASYVIREDLLPTMYTQQYFGDIIAYAATKNIRVMPLMNSYGHNSLLPRMIPEISAKDPEGAPKNVGFCTSSEKTYEVLFNIYDEIIDKYLTPNGIDAFHIGLDEVQAHELCECEKCRGISGYKRALEHAIRIIRHLKEKGIRHVHMFYDTVFGFFRTTAGKYLSLEGAPQTQEEIDAYVAEAAERFRQEGIHDVTVLNWWNYSADEKMFYSRDLNSSFRSILMPMTGYYHWVAPMERNNNILGGAKRAIKYGFEGFLAYSSWEHSYDRPYHYLAQVGWNKQHIDTEEFYARYARSICPEAPELTAPALQVLGEYSQDDRTPNLFGKLAYYWTSYKRAGLPYPRCWFGDIKEKFDADPEKYRKFFAEAFEKAANARKLLEQAPIADPVIKKSLAASAAHFEISAQCFAGLFGILMGEETNVPEKLAQIITLYDRLLVIAADARIPCTYYHYARDISIQRELCVNALRKIQENPALTLPETECMGSEMLTVLR